MKVITVRTQVREVAERWRKQYSTKAYANDTEKQGIAKRLDNLDPETATAEDVEAIIGNRSWAELPKCHECGKRHPVVVEIGEPVEYESATAQLCYSCLSQAALLAVSTTY